VCLLKEARIQLSVAVCVAVCNTLHHRAAAAVTHCNTLYYRAANLKYMCTSYTAVHHTVATTEIHYYARCSVLQCAVYCSVLCTLFCSVLQRVAACCSALLMECHSSGQRAHRTKAATIRHSVLQRVAARCSALLMKFHSSGGHAHKIESRYYTGWQGRQLRKK